jgi:hypothetical protein
LQVVVVVVTTSVAAVAQVVTELQLVLVGLPLLAIP